MIEQRPGGELSPKDRVLAKVLDIIDERPVAVMSAIAPAPGVPVFLFGVGRCPAYGTRQTPRQVMFAYIGDSEVVALGVRAADKAEDFRVRSFEPKGVVDITDPGHPILASDEDITDIADLLDQTGFTDGAGVQELMARYEQPGRYEKWIAAFFDPALLVDL